MLPYEKKVPLALLGNLICCNLKGVEMKKIE